MERVCNLVKPTLRCGDFWWRGVKKLHLMFVITLPIGIGVPFTGAL